MTDALSRRALIRALPIVALSLPLAGCLTAKTPPTDAGNARTLAALDSVNTLRKSRGLPPLRPDPAATEAALVQAARMAKAGKMAHRLSPTDDFGARVKSSGVTLPAAENIATGQDSTAEAVTAWINSPKHLENMLGNYSGLGVAVAYDAGRGNRPYWAMILSN
jgi:uncharacterized protein YkwD